jgi:FG-GAP-like repeat
MRLHPVLFLAFFGLPLSISTSISIAAEPSAPPKEAMKARPIKANDPMAMQLENRSKPVGTLLIDVNGDGKADLLFQGVDNRFWLSLSTGNGFADPKFVLEHYGPFEPRGTHYADVNGDGMADIIYQTVDNVFWLCLQRKVVLSFPFVLLDMVAPLIPMELE